MRLIHPLSTPGKFQDPEVTADGKVRARVPLVGLKTLWFNTGTLCNLTCRHCYIESSPRNDRLLYLTGSAVVGYLNEIRHLGFSTEEIGFTGGEPCMNPDLPAMVRASLERGFRVLVLTNAMRPMQKIAAALLELKADFADRLCVRVSVDHYLPEKHEQERGPKSWAPMLEGMIWLAGEGFNLQVAGRNRWHETEPQLRQGFADLFREHGISLNARDPHQLLLFPEMDPAAEVPEITVECWKLLGVDPASMMCATSRMVVHHKGAPGPTVAPCTLLPYADQAGRPERLADSLGDVWLNHVHCARFCVLGGGNCSA